MTQLKNWYVTIDTGTKSRSYAGVIRAIDKFDAMGVAGQILSYPTEFERVDIFECDVKGAPIDDGDRIEIRPRHVCAHCALVLEGADGVWHSAGSGQERCDKSPTSVHEPKPRT